MSIQKEQNINLQQKEKYEGQELDDLYSQFKPFEILPKIEKFKMPFEAPDQSPNISQVDSSFMVDFCSKNKVTQKQSLIHNKLKDYFKIGKILGRCKARIFEQSKLLSLQQKIKLPFHPYQFQQFQNSYNNQNSSSDKKLIFNQENVVLLIFDKLMLFFLLCMLLLVPFLWSFEKDDLLTLSMITKIGNIVFAFDVLVKFNTTIISKGNVISDRIQIFKLRLKYFISLDIFLIGSLNYLNSSDEIIFPILFFLIGFIKFNQYFDNFIEFLNFSSIILEIMSLIKLLISVLLISHFIACIWHYIGIKSFQIHQNNWLSAKNLENENSATKYIYSLYWAIVTMVTVGYGDICPQNRIEVLTATIIMVFSSGVYAFTLNKIGQVVQNLSDVQQLKSDSIRTITSYMKYHSITPQLQGKVRNYFDYQFNLQRVQNKVDVQKIINSLSIELRSEIMIDIFNDMTKQTQFFKLNFNQNTIKKFSSLLQLNFYASGSTISNQSDTDYSLFFVDYGTVFLIEENSNTILSEFNRGEFFGEQSFFTGNSIKLKTISKSFSRVYEIKRSDFIQILDTEEQYKLKQISHQFQQNLPIKGYNCQICKQSCHNSLNCNLFNYVPDCEKIILRYRFSKQERMDFIRNQRKKIKCLSNLNVLFPPTLQKILTSQIDFIIQQQDQQENSNNQISEQSNQEPSKASKEELNSKTSLMTIYNQGKKKSSNSLFVQKGPPTMQKSDTIGITPNQADTKLQIQDNNKGQQPLDKIVTGITNIDQKNSKSLIKGHQKLVEPDFDLFDRMKIFSSYFPHNNFDIVIENFNLVNKTLQNTKAKTQKYSLFSTAPLKFHPGNPNIKKNKKKKGLLLK